MFLFCFFLFYIYIYKKIFIYFFLKPKVTRAQIKTDNLVDFSCVAITFFHPSLDRFCHSCLQECLRPQKPVCAVCRGAPGHWTKAAQLEALIQSSVAACKGCGTQVSFTTDQKLKYH